LVKQPVSNPYNNTGVEKEDTKDKEASMDVVGLLPILLKIPFRLPKYFICA